MPNIGVAEIVIILVLALLVFGPKRLPEMGRSIGRGVREFKKASDTARKEFGVNEIEREIKGVKQTLTDVKGDLKIDIDAETAKGGGGQDEVLVGEVVDDAPDGRPADEPAATDATPRS